MAGNKQRPSIPAIDQPAADTLQIDLARDGDISELCGLLGILFEQEREFTADPLRQRQALTAMLPDAERGQILVARQDGCIVAMVSLLYGISTALGGRIAWLEDMIVLPSHRGRGIGSRLLEHAIAHARDQRCLRLTLLTDADNLAAQRFYRSKGFELSAMQTLRLLL